MPTGSAAYAADCAAQRMDIVAYFNLDMTGYLEQGSDIHVNLMYTSQDSLLGNYVKRFSRTYFPDMRIWQDWLAWGDSDYSSFNRNGYAAHPHPTGCLGRERQQFGAMQTLHRTQPRHGGHLGWP